MRWRLSIAVALVTVAGASCNSLLGNDDHSLAPKGPVDASTPYDAGPGGGDAAAALDGSGTDGAAAGGEAGSPGGSVPPTSGGIYTVGRVADDAGAHTLPDGAVVTLTDDGFEFGETLCKGKTCVTGAITP